MMAAVAFVGALCSAWVACLVAEDAYAKGNLNLAALAGTVCIGCGVIALTILMNVG